MKFYKCTIDGSSRVIKEVYSAFEDNVIFDKVMDTFNKHYEGVKGAIGFSVKHITEEEYNKKVKEGTKND